MEIIFYLLFASLGLPVLIILVTISIFKISDWYSGGEMTRDVDEKVFPYESRYPDKHK